MAVTQRLQVPLNNSMNPNQVNNVESDIQSVNDVLLTSPSQHVQQEQDLEFAKAQLLGSVASIAFLGNLIPMPCYCNWMHACGDVKHIHIFRADSVDRTLECLQKENNALLKDFSVPTIRVFGRGCSKIVDQILDYLETGVFDALNKKIILALHLTVNVDETNVLQTYIFSFKYTESAEAANRRFLGFSIASQSGNSVYLEAETFDIDHLISDLHDLTHSTSTLQRPKILNMHILHTPDCPIDYKTTLFSKIHSYDISTGVLTYREVEVHNDVDTSMHEVGSSINDTGDIMDEDANDVPRALTLPEATNIVDASVSNDSMLAMSGNGSTPATQMSENLNAINCRNEKDTSAHMSAQDREAVEISANLNAVLPSLHPQEHNLSPMQPDEESCPQLNQQKLAELQQRQLSSIIGSQQTDQTYSFDAIKCECGSTKENDDMLQCDYCGTWQHAHCYGFFEAEDPNIPKTHACYKCLLGDKELYLYYEMCDLALFRRALWIMYNEGYPESEAELSAALDCDAPTVSRVLKRLKQTMLLIDTPRSQRDGLVKSVLSQHASVEAKDEVNQSAAIYFSPMAKISHHYIIPVRCALSPGKDEQPCQSRQEFQNRESNDRTISGHAQTEGAAVNEPLNEITSIYEDHSTVAEATRVERTLEEEVQPSQDCTLIQPSDVCGPEGRQQAGSNGQGGIGDGVKFSQENTNKPRKRTYGKPKDNVSASKRLKI